MSTPEQPLPDTVVHGGSLDHHIYLHTDDEPEGSAPTAPVMETPLPPAPRGHYIPGWDDPGLRALGIALGAVALALLVTALVFWISSWKWSDNDHDKPANSIAQILQNRGFNPDKLRVCRVERIDNGNLYHVTVNAHSSCHEAISFDMLNARTHLDHKPRYTRASATMGFPVDDPDLDAARKMSAGEILQNYYRLVTLKLPPRFKVNPAKPVVTTTVKVHVGDAKVVAKLKSR